MSRAGQVLAGAGAAMVGHHAVPHPGSAGDACSSEQLAHPLGQSDHCALGRDGNTRTARVFWRRPLSGQPVPASFSFLSHSCWANRVVSRTHSRSKYLFSHGPLSRSPATADVLLAPWTSSHGN